MATPVLLLEEIGLHRRLVDRDRAREQTERQYNGQAHARLQVDLQSPDHGDGDQRKEQVGEYVDRGVEDADVFEDGCVVALPRADWRAQSVVPAGGYRRALEDDGEGGADGEDADEC
jgi:hypothetical protein